MWSDIWKAYIKKGFILAHGLGHSPSRQRWSGAVPPVLTVTSHITIGDKKQRQEDKSKDGWQPPRLEPSVSVSHTSKAPQAPQIQWSQNIEQDSSVGEGNCHQSWWPVASFFIWDEVSPCSPCWPGTQRYTCLCLSSTELKVCKYILPYQAHLAEEENWLLQVVLWPSHVWCGTHPHPQSINHKLFSFFQEVIRLPIQHLAYPHQAEKVSMWIRT